MWLDMPDREGLWEFKGADGVITRFDVYLRENYPTLGRSAWYATNERITEPCDWFFGEWRFVSDEYQSRLKDL